MKKVFVYDPTAKDKLSSVRGVGRYLQILKENFPDWTFTNTLHAIRYTLYPIFINPFFNFLQKPLTMRRLAKKQIAVIHDLIPLKYPSHFPAGIRGNINIFLNKLALKNYDLIVTDSEASKHDIINILGIREKKIKVIYPYLPRIFTNLESKFQNSELIDSTFLNLNSKFCLYVGDATWNKNLVNLARAIKIINVTCVFVGRVFGEATGVEEEGFPTARSGGILIDRAPAGVNPRQAPSLNHPWQKEFRQFLEETKDDKRFIFAGFLPDSELIKFYQQASINVLLSRDEGFGFSFLEAASQGCPSVLSNIPVLNEISGRSLKGQFLKGQSLFANPENPNDIADKIGEVYFNKELKKSLGDKAKKRGEFFSPKKFRKEFLNII